MSYASEVLADSPKAWFRMQETSGLIQDSSGLAHHATASTGTTTYQQPSPIVSDGSDFAIDFNADNFSIPDHADLDWGDTFTVEAWVKRGDLGTTRAMCGRGSQAVTVGVDSATNQWFFARADIALICNSTITLAQDTWYHVVTTKDGTTSKIYIDGIDRTGTVTNSTFASVAVPLIIGADYNGTIGWLGDLDEVAFYSTALSQTRVQAHYNAAFNVNTDRRLLALGVG